MRRTVEDKAVLPHLVKDAEVLKHIPVSRRTLGTLMKLQKDPLPSHKIGQALFFDLEEVAAWWKRWTKRSRSEQEVLQVEPKKTRQGGRISLLQRG
jgi:hypothetical protein